LRVGKNQAQHGACLHIHGRARKDRILDDVDANKNSIGNRIWQKNSNHYLDVPKLREG